MQLDDRSGEVPGFAAMRGRVGAIVFFAASAQCALMAQLGQPQFPIDHYPRIAVAVVGFGTLVGAYTWYLRDRIDQGRFVALVVLWTALFAAYFAPVLPLGSTIAAEWSALCPMIMAAVFVDRRVVAVLLCLLGTVAMGGVVAVRLAGDPSIWMVLAIELWVALAVAGVVRALREVAVGALVKASRGEVTDPLTGLSNRRGLERRVAHVWQDSVTADVPVSLLVVDVDHFKQINDTRGHAAGDEVIRTVADILNASLRGGDVAVRLGGEEFLILLRAPVDLAAKVGERLRAAIEGSALGVTVSVGVVEARPGPDDDPPAALWRAVDSADQAMYEAKRTGRNRVVTVSLPGADSP